MGTARVVILAVIVFVVLLAGGYYLYLKQVKNADQLAQSPAPTPITGFSASPTPSASPIGSKPGAALQPSTGDDNQNPDLGISLSSPSAGTKITSPVRVLGSANVFEGQVRITILDSNGKVIGEGNAKGCMGETKCYFETTISFDKSSTQTGSIQAYSSSPKDGKVEYSQEVLVAF